MHVKLGDEVERGQPLFTLHGESGGELAYARAFAEVSHDMVVIEPS
jgi:thymidine phosphorylase